MVAAEMEGKAAAAAAAAWVAGKKAAVADLRKGSAAAAAVGGAMVRATGARESEGGVMASARVVPLALVAASELAPNRGEGLHTQRYLS